MADLFDTSKQNIDRHVVSVLLDKELDENSVVKCFLTTAAESHVSEIYDEFALRRKNQEAIDADRADLAELQEIENEAKHREK